MHTIIVPVRHSVLKPYIQYFIFFNHHAQEQFSYQTFPNTNLCLTIYKNNKVDYKRNKNENHCTITTSQHTFSSRLFGFHEQPFKVDVNHTLDQVCILFHPAGLRAFTKVPYAELLNESAVFECIFGDQTFMLEELFEHNDPQRRSDLMEAFLMERLKTTDIDYRTQSALDCIYKTKGNISVYELSRSLKINESTQYRSFKADIGQSPKDFIQTVRFRNTLKLLLEQDFMNFTELSYKAMFYDQAHFIKDFKRRSGMSPHRFYQNILLEQRLLAWVIKN
ncbi:AraC family transcriptional regulator [Pedobacter sp. Hv1]|uniref:helix-turn-helix domain-containing protein n=1 Tax=Pedobacter sp. Hv1 TaxID=1740090 RepID=UPI0006D8D21C|nr:helix-turn-helix domain-containing protein [Pedobacter sp. Hv1]KQC02009.1 hypothetical protein AQF98_00080 [Pedobacter sp. Hv1]